MQSVWDVIWNEREDRLRAPWRFVMGGLLFVFLLITIAVVTAVLPDPETISEPIVSSVYGTGRLLLLLALLLGALIGTSMVVDRREWHDLGLQLDRQWWRDCAVGLALGLAVTTVVVGLALVTGLGSITGVLESNPVDSLLPIATGTPALVTIVLLAAFYLGVAVGEEILIRGYLMTNLAEGFVAWFTRTGAVAAAGGATAVIFGGLHATNPNATIAGIASITAAGLLFAAMYGLTGRLGLPIGFHLTWNFGLGAVFGTVVSGFPADASLVTVEFDGPTWLTGGPFGLEGGLLGILGFALATAGALWWIRREYGLHVAESVTQPDLRSDPFEDASDESEEPEDADDAAAEDVDES